MKQYELSDKELILRVKKSPIFVRVMLYLFTILSFFLPIIGMIFSLVMGNDFHFVSLIGIGLFGLLGFYLLRVSLWNTYGREIINFDDKKIKYEADYGWFKDTKKIIELNRISFSIKQIGYHQDNKGVLIIGSDDSSMECVTKMRLDEINELIEKLKAAIGLPYKK